MEMPKKVQNQLAQYQQLEQQASMIFAQKQQLELRSREIEKTLEILKTFRKGDIYKSIGNLLIRADSREKVIHGLKEEKETLDVRIKTLEKQVGRMRERLSSLQKEISSAVRTSS